MTRQFDHLQERTLDRIRARIPAGCPLRVERRPLDEARRTFNGFRVTGPGCEAEGRAAVVTAFVDGYVAAWERREDPRPGTNAGTTGDRGSVTYRNETD
jgi:hypothetical protein